MFKRIAFYMVASIVTVSSCMQAAEVRELGQQAVAPELVSFFEQQDCPEVFIQKMLQDNPQVAESLPLDALKIIVDDPVFFTIVVVIVGSFLLREGAKREQSQRIGE